MKIKYADEYKVSPRVTLKPGDKFRVSKGPYWKSESGEKISMAVRGVCVFKRCHSVGARVFIEAVGESGQFELLHVKGRRKNADMPQLVCRPYVIKGRVTGRKRKKARGRKKDAAA